jgi:hypothetical protein
VWGDRIGMLAASALVAFTSTVALSEIVPIGPGVVVPAVAVSLLLGVSTSHGLPLAVTIFGRGLFTVCVVLAAVLL